MKKFGTVALSLALAASLTVPAFAADGLLISPAPAGDAEVMPISAPLTGGYAAKLVLNGSELDSSAIPAAVSPDMVPLRLVAESDHGSASWFEEENQGFFYLGDARIIVNFADNTILVNDAPVEGLAVVVSGLTFTPAGVLNVVVVFAVAADGDSLTITTPNNDPIIKLAYSIMDASGIYAGMKSDISVFAENFSLAEGTFEKGFMFTGFNTTPDRLLVAKLADGADVDAVKEAIETDRQAQEDTFSWYLAHNLPKVEAAQVVVNGDYVLYVIGETAEKGVELFNDFVEAQK